MKHPLHRLLFLLLLLTLSFPAVRVLGQATPSAAVVDEEYERYKKRGDELYKEGKYQLARQQYQNCLEVPNFENDTYAKEQIAECTTGQNLHQQVDELLRQGKNPEAFKVFGQLLNLNPDDALAKAKMADYYEREGNNLFKAKNYAAAIANYKEALNYTTTRQETLQIQIKNAEVASRPIIPKRIGLKVFTGLAAVGAGAYAYLLRSDYQTKIDALTQISQTADPTSTGIIANPDTYRQYNDAYTAAEAAKQKKRPVYCLFGYSGRSDPCRGLFTRTQTPHQSFQLETFVAVVGAGHWVLVLIFTPSNFFSDESSIHLCTLPDYI